MTPVLGRPQSGPGSILAGGAKGRARSDSGREISVLAPARTVSVSAMGQSRRLWAEIAEFPQNPGAERGHGARDTPCA
jgi:hypothetical protein